MMRVDFGWLLILLIRRKNTQLVRKMKQRFPIAVNVGQGNMDSSPRLQL